MGNFTRLMKYVFKYWYLFVISLVITAITSYLGVMPVLLERQVLNAVTPPIDADAVLDMIPKVVLTIFGIHILNNVLGFAQNFIQQYSSQKVIYTLRNDIFSALTQKSFSFYDKSRVGDIVSRVTSDVNQVQQMTSFWILQVVSVATQYVIWIGVLLSLGPLITAICFIGGPLSVFIMNRFRKLSLPLYETQRKLVADMNVFLQQNIVGMRVVRLFSQENKEKEEHSMLNTKSFDVQLNLTKMSSLYWGINGRIRSMLTGLIFWVGGRLIIGTVGTPNAFKWGDLTLSTQGIYAIIGPFSFIGSIAQMYSQAMAASERIFEIIDREPDIKDSPNAFNIPTIKGEIVIENVSFGYEKDKPVLTNINLKVNPGETIAILGPTGSGKSTLLYLIPRFYDVTSGKITIDGHDIKDAKLKSLREQFGIALQETFLFSASFKENIAFGRPDASMKEIVEAAKAAQIHDFIESLPKKYNALIGERGITLSGGQKQRLTIARTLLTNPRILIFDDTTSFVDTETEYKIQKALEILLEGRTSFIITQRLSTIKGADKIIVLEKGKIAENGTHEELLTKDGVYATIYRTQFAPREEILAKRKEGGK